MSSAWIVVKDVANFLYSPTTESRSEKTSRLFAFTEVSGIRDEIVIPDAKDEEYEAVPLSQDPAKAREFLGWSRVAGAKSLRLQTGWRWVQSGANQSLGGNAC